MTTFSMGGASYAAEIKSAFIVKQMLNGTPFTEYMFVEYFLGGQLRKHVTPATVCEKQFNPAYPMFVTKAAAFDDLGDDIEIEAVGFCLEDGAEAIRARLPAPVRFVAGENISARISVAPFEGCIACEPFFDFVTGTGRLGAVEFEVHRDNAESERFNVDLQDGNLSMFYLRMMSVRGAVQRIKMYFGGEAFYDLNVYAEGSYEANVTVTSNNGRVGFTPRSDIVKLSNAAADNVSILPESLSDDLAFGGWSLPVIAASPNGELVAMEFDGSVIVTNASGKTVYTVIERAGCKAKAVCLTNSGALCAAFEKCIVVSDGRKELGSIDVVSTGVALTETGGYKWVYAVTGDGMRIYRLAGDNFELAATIPDVRGVAASGDEALVMTNSRIMRFSGNSETYSVSAAAAQFRLAGDRYFVGIKGDSTVAIDENGSISEVSDSAPIWTGGRLICTADGIHCYDGQDNEVISEKVSNAFASSKYMYDFSGEATTRHALCGESSVICSSEIPAGTSNISATLKSRVGSDSNYFYSVTIGVL